MLDLSHIRPGLTGTAALLVGPEDTAPRVGSGRIAVLATPVMINLIGNVMRFDARVQRKLPNAP
jgi:fluoroacetyl-CoA thioesterase